MEEEEADHKVVGGKEKEAKVVVEVREVGVVELC